MPFIREEDDLPIVTTTVLLIILAGVLLLVSGCALQGGTVNLPTKPLVASLRAVAVVVEDPQGRPIQGAVCGLDGGSDQGVSSNADGYVLFRTVPTSLRATQLTCSAEGYVRASEHRDLWTGANEDLEPITLTAAHVDPSRFTLDELKGKLRGSLSVRLNLPYGPRPNQDSNIAWMAFYELQTPANRQRMLDAFHARGLTMSAIGPVTGNDCYHEQFPNIGDPPSGGLMAGCLHNWRVPTQDEWDAYLDGVQEQWDGGIMPCYFAKPDGWERAEYGAEIAALEQLYQQPRAQRLLRCVVGPGWEPSGEKYGWANREYVRWVQWGARVFPTALRGIHLVADLDAPTGQDDDSTFPAKQGNALSWVNVAPYIHFFADQLGGYVFGSTEQPSAHFLDELCKHVKRVGDGFRGGYGWPSAGADGTRILHVVFEYAAFADWWKNFAEKYSWQIGDEAMRCGADGYGDGGTVPVPVWR